MTVRVPASVTRRGASSTPLTGVVFGVVALGVTVMIVINVAATGTSSQVADAWPLFAAIATVYGVVGALLVSRVPRNAIGWLMFFVAAGLGASLTGEPYAALSLQRYGGTLPLTVIVAWGSSMLVTTALVAAIVFLPLLFPTGAPPSPRWRPVVWIGAACILVNLGLTAVMPGPIPDFPDVVNPFGLDAVGALAAALQPLLVLLPALLVPVGFASVVIRYRRGGTVERLQIRWFALGALVVFVTLLSSFLPSPVGDLSWILLWPAMGFLPVTVVIAILRYRLYDLDRLVSRTIAWAVTTGAIVAVFGAGLVLLQTVLAGVTQGATLAVAASTLAAFAAFQPVRRRVQSAVDRRFNRARYDALRVADGFAERLRADMPLPVVAGELADASRTALEPRSVVVWLRSPVA